MGSLYPNGQQSLIDPSNTSSQPTILSICYTSKAHILFETGGTPFQNLKTPFENPQTRFQNTETRFQNSETP